MRSPITWIPFTPPWAQPPTVVLERAFQSVYELDSPAERTLMAMLDEGDDGDEQFVSWENDA